MGEAEVVGARPQATERGTKVYFVKQLQVRDDGMLGSVLPNGDDYWRELDFADGTLCESRWSSVRGGCRFGLEPSLWALSESGAILGVGFSSSALLCLGGSSTLAAQVTSCRRANDPIFRHKS
jgi:hypothetical protein